MKRCLMLVIACGLLLVASSTAQARGQKFSSGSALSLDGTNDYVSVPLTSPPASNYTLSAWVYLRAGGDFNGARMAVLSSPMCGGSVELLIRSATGNASDPQYLELGRCGDFNGTSSTSTVPLASWTHLAVTVSDTKWVNYFINGNQAGTWSAAGLNVDVGSTIHVGDNISRKFNGMLDEVHIWTNTLTQAEIQSNMNRRVVGSEPGLYAYFPMDEGGGGVVTDAAAAGGVATGTLNNGAAWAPETTFIPSIGTANRFPSPIMVSGITNGVSRMAVTLTGLAHPFLSDLDILLVNPAGQNVMLMSDVSNDIPGTNLTIRFDDTATSHLPANGGGGVVSGTYRPTDYFADESFPAPAPAGPYTTTNLAPLLSGVTNGVWSLYIVDGGAGNQGSLQGWSVTFFPANDGGPTLFVATNGSHQAPYSTWATAATNIQAAIDFADEGDTVLVSNGVYETGGRVAPGSPLTNRVFIDSAIEVRSVNGPAFTTIRGNSTSGGDAVRCVWMTNGATLVGFTLTQGSAINEGGGGVWAQSTSAVVSSCVLMSNIALFAGGGALGGTLNNCTLTGNGLVAAYEPLSGYGGGGAYASTLNNCMLSFNYAQNTPAGGTNFYGEGGGASGCTLNNCTLTGNSAGRGGGVYETSSTFFNGTVDNCIVYSNSAPDDANYNLFSTPNYTCTTPLPNSGSGNITNNPMFENPSLGYYQLKTNSPCRNAGNNAYASGATDLAGNPRIVGVNVDMGAYEIPPPPVDRTVHYANLNSTNPLWPFATWETAAVNIQDAIVAADVGDTVLVSNGVYQTGEFVYPANQHPNRVVIDKPIKVRSVNGPAVTTIRGSGASGGAAVRCVWMENGASLVGFTLTNGAAPSGGGQAVGPGSETTVSNCVLTGNTASSGGGSYLGQLYNCLLVGNYAQQEGGGAFGCTLVNCTLTGNSSGDQGGGAQVSFLRNSIVVSNTGPAGANYSFDCDFSYSCTTPLPGGTGNIASDPLFVNAAAGDYRLLASSPCINSGDNANAPGVTDLDGSARIVGATVDMGAYEYNQVTASYDSDADGFTDAEEYIADTQPTNGASFFPDVLLTNAPAGQLSLLIDQSSTGRIYGVFINTNLLQTPQAWTLVPPEQTGTAASLTLTITNTLPAANYRAGVRLP